VDPKLGYNTHEKKSKKKKHENQFLINQILNDEIEFFLIKNLTNS
jgi:hypothetical protein